MQTPLYFLDLIGTFSFAVYGTYFALRKGFDIFGIFVAAFLSALGGGTIREIILGNLPFYFFDMRYVLAVVLGVALAISIYRQFHKIKTFALLLDSLGLVTFAFIGASMGAQMGLGIFAIVFLATITAVGGGVLRDILLSKSPQIMQRDFYASVAVVLGLIYALAPNQMQNICGAGALLTFCFTLRVLVIHFKVNLWKPKI